jgi:hypothetical protein
VIERFRELLRQPPSGGIAEQARSEP